MAAIAGLIGIAPQDEIEGMIAAQLIAAHNATMECYRRAMIGEQTLEGRRDNLSQANKLSRTYVGSTRCAQSPPRQGPAESHGRARPCACRRAGGGRHGRDPEGRGSTEIRGSTPCKTNCPCTSAGGVERGQGTGAVAGRRRCRTAAAGCTAGMSPGAPKGNKNALKHGRYTAEAVVRRREISELMRLMKALASRSDSREA